MFSKDTASEALRKAAYDRGLRGEWTWTWFGVDYVKLVDSAGEEYILPVESIDGYKFMSWSDL